MNHGGLGYLNENGDLALHPDLLDLLCFGHGSSLYGLYYPRPKDDPKYSNISVDHDFMLTPIPPKYWNKCVRLRIHLRQDKLGALKKVSEILQRNSATIIHSESTRSGYKFATWTIHIAFTWLSDSLLTYTQQGQYYNETKTALMFLVDALYNECDDCLFIDDDSEDLNRNSAIRYELNGELAFFHNKIYGTNLNDNEKINYHPFEMKLSNEGDMPLLSAYSNEIKRIILGLNSQRSILPAITFAELDSKVLNIRMAVIPEIDSDKFIEIGIKYERIGGEKKENHSTGLMKTLLANLPKEYNLWRTYNFTKINTSTLEEGGIVLLIEDQDKSPYNDPKKRVESTCRILEGINEINGMKINIRAMPSFVNKAKILHSIKTSKHKIHSKKLIFISHANADKEFAEKLADKLSQNSFIPFLYEMDNLIGDNFYHKIRENLNNAWEICVLCSRHGLDSTWVQSEWLAAWLMQKTISPIFLPGFKLSMLPTQLQSIVGISYDDTDKYIGDLRERSEIEEIVAYNNFMK